MSANILGCKDRDVLEISNRESMFFFKFIPILTKMNHEVIPCVNSKLK